MANTPVMDFPLDIEIDVTAPGALLGGDEGCEAVLPSLDSQVLPGSADLRTCEMVTAYLIWPLRCDDRA